MNYTCKKLGKQYEIVYANGKMYKCNERVPDTYALNIEWGANGIGFGELNIKYNEKTGKWSKDTEYMSDEFCQAVLAKWLAGMERS